MSCGLDCPKCGAETIVKDTRARPDGNIRRRRRCPNCRHGFMTVEARIDDAPLDVTPLGGLYLEAHPASEQASATRTALARSASKLVSLLTLVSASDVELLLALATRCADAAVHDDTEVPA